MCVCAAFDVDRPEDCDARLPSAAVDFSFDALCCEASVTGGFEVLVADGVGTFFPFCELERDLDSFGSPVFGVCDSGLVLV